MDQYGEAKLRFLCRGQGTVAIEASTGAPGSDDARRPVGGLLILEGGECFDSRRPERYFVFQSSLIGGGIMMAGSRVIPSDDAAATLARVRATRHRTRGDLQTRGGFSLATHL